MFVEGGVQLHWLFPKMDMDDGLILLYDDNACCKIAKHIADGVVADIYVEEVVVE
jgi:alpha-galactosidase